VTNIEDVHKAYSKTLHIENYHLIDVPLATYIAKDLDGDRLFLIGKGSSGGGKTAFTEPLRRLGFNHLSPASTEEKENKKYNVFFISKVTPASFACGKGKESATDLGHHLQKKASFLIYSDLAPLMSMNEETRRELFGLFRDLFDGFIKYDTAQAQKFYKNIKVNSMGFATHMIETQTDMAQMMGTREIIYELPELQDVEEAMKKRDTPENKELRSNVIKDFLDDIGKVENDSWKYDGVIESPEKSKDLQSHLKLIKHYALQASVDRTPAQVDDNGLLIRHIKTEFPMRLNNQLQTLFGALLALDVDYKLAFQYIRRIALTCGNSIRQEIINHLWKVEDTTKVIEGKTTQEYGEGTPTVIEPKVVGGLIDVPINKNANQLGYELNIAPREILKHLMILRDMKKVAPFVDIKKEKWDESIFSLKREWMALARSVKTEVT